LRSTWVAVRTVGAVLGGRCSTGQDVLDDSGIVRTDIRSSFGAATTTAQGIPLTISLTVKDLATSTALVGAAVYLWHCDRDGNYSMYSQAAANENHLRGVQVADDRGTATFTSIFPACYSGRWPHIHFEVHENVADATTSGPIAKTSQIALPRRCGRGLRDERLRADRPQPVAGLAADGQRRPRRRRHAPARDDVG
jgi:protocatechuate 3,4-dioxygenase beta subunit